MARTPVTGRSCPNVECDLTGERNAGNIVRHSFYPRRDGRRRRYRCKACGKTFSANTDTIYQGLHCSRDEFDRVAQLSVEGVNKSAISRVSGRAWSTVARWLALASEAARQINDRMIQGFELKELQADELRTFCGSKKNVTWVFTSLEVWSRLWVATVIGRRSYANTYKLLSETARRGRIVTLVLITTDGFKYYAIVIRRVFGHACVHAQVVKTWCKNRVHTVKLKIVIGSRGQLDRALAESEDSIKLNTAFVERSNLTTRTACAYLARKTSAHARDPECLEDNLELVRCHYNFVRRHRGLRFGSELRTPAMQAGLTTRPLTLREIFLSATRTSRRSISVTILPTTEITILRTAA